MLNLTKKPFKFPWKFCLCRHAWINQWFHNKSWLLWWPVSLSIRIQSTLNHIRFVFYHNIKAPFTRIRIFLNPQLFLSGYENIRVHTLCDHSVFISNSPVHTYPDSLRIHWGLTKLSHQALVRPGLTQYRRGRHCFPTRLSCFCRPFCPVDNVKSLQMSSRLLA